MRKDAFRPSDEDQARSWLLTNLLVLPGLGSVLGGKRVGYVQAVLAVTGMLFSMVFVVAMVREWWSMRTIPELTGRLFIMGVGGVFVFGCAWLWGLFTGLGLLRDARRG